VGPDATPLARLRDERGLSAPVTERRSSAGRNVVRTTHDRPAVSEHDNRANFRHVLVARSSLDDDELALRALNRTRLSLPRRAV
jgi:hypothetical protein